MNCFPEVRGLEYGENSSCENIVVETVVKLLSYTPYSILKEVDHILYLHDSDGDR